LKEKSTHSFENLHVYQKARELTNAVYDISRSKGFSQDFSLVNQIRRATISIVSNIAEGFERGSTTEFIQFLYVAKGSCGEVRAQLQIARDQHYLSENDCFRLDCNARQVSSMISNFITYLKNSPYKGRKFTINEGDALSSDENNDISSDN